MDTYIALLRGINVGGNKKIKMADLRALYDSLGFESVQTLLQSGNVIFKSASGDDLAQRIETAIQARFGFESRIIIRTATQWQDIISNHPFTDTQLDEPRKLQIVFMLEALESIEPLRNAHNAHNGTEIIHHSRQELYIVYPNGMGRSKLSNNLIERKLETVTTGRNWNTVNKILAACQA